MAVVQFIVCVLFLGATSALHHTRQILDHHDHANYIAGFPCHQPQPKAFSVKKLLSEREMHGKAYFPDITVLHHCDECTGSCGPGTTCSVDMSDVIRLPFLVTFIQDVEGNLKSYWKVEDHIFLNHTKCACTKPSSHGNLPNHYENLHVLDLSMNKAELPSSIHDPSFITAAMDTVGSSTSWPQDSHTLPSWSPDYSFKTETYFRKSIDQGEESFKDSYINKSSIHDPSSIQSSLDTVESSTSGHQDTHISPLWIPDHGFKTETHFLSSRDQREESFKDSYINKSSIHDPSSIPSSVDTVGSSSSWPANDYHHPSSLKKDVSSTAEDASLGWLDEPWDC